MNGEARKLQLIQALLKVDDEATLMAVENLLNLSETKPVATKTLDELSGIWTEEEADEMKRIIEGGCEQIHPDDWK